MVSGARSSSSELVKQVSIRQRMLCTSELVKQVSIRQRMLCTSVLVKHVSIRQRVADTSRKCHSFCKSFFGRTCPVSELIGNRDSETMESEERARGRSPSFCKAQIDTYQAVEDRV